MAKVAPRRQRRRRDEGGTNWMLIGGIVAIGVIGLFALLFLTLDQQGQPTPTPGPILALEEFCTANEVNCIEKGDPDAPVTVVEVSDYGCSHCRNFNLESAAAFDEEYVDTGQVQWVVVPYGLSDTTAASAEAAMCAAEQGSFFEFHRGLFEIQTTPEAHTREGFLQVAEDLDMDLDAFEACLDAGTYSNEVQRNIAQAAQAGVTGTPTFFVNGAVIPGNAPAQIQAEIESALGS